MAEEFTSKFSVDITDLKKGMQQANQLMKVATSEFKAATGGMNRWAESADGLSAKLKQLNATEDAQKAKLALLTAEYDKVVAAEGENSKGAQDLYIRINNLKGEIGKTEAQMRHYSARLAEVQTAEAEAAKSAQEEENALESLQTVISGQEAQLSKLKAQYAQVVLEQGETSKEARTLAKEIASLSRDLADNQSKLSDAEGAADKFDQSLNDVGDAAEDASGGFTVMKGALAELVSNGIKAAVDAFKDLATASSEANANFQAQTGASAKEMEKFSDSIERVYSHNFGESMQDVAEAMAQVKQQTGEIDPSKLEKMTENGIALRDTFGFDLNESMRAVNMLMQQFGLTSDQAFNLVVKGAQNGLDKNGDLLDTINEYSVHYKQQGYTADEFYNSLINGSASGTFSVDKLGDAMKEFGIRTKDTAKSTDEGFKLLGLNADQMRKDFAAGGDTAQEATKKVLESLFSMDDQVKQNQAGVDLFGTMWEDLGVEGVKALMDVSGKAATTTDAMKQLNDVKYADVGSSISSIGRALQVEFLQPLVDQVTPAVANFAKAFVEKIPAVKEAISEVADKLQAWIPLFAGIGTAMATYFAVSKIQKFITFVRSGEAAIKLMAKAQTVLNTVMSLNPIGLIIAAIAGLVAAFVVLWNKSEAFRNFWIGLWETVSGAFSAVWNGIVNFFTVTIPGAFNSAKEAVGGFVSGVVQWFQQLPGRISEFIGNVLTSIGEWAINMRDKAIETGQNFLNGVITFFQNLPENIGFALGFAIGTVARWGVDLWTKAVEIGKAFLENVVTFFRELPGNILTFLQNVISNVSNWAVSMKRKAVETGQNFITNVVNFFKQLPGRISAFLQSVITSVAAWAINMKNKAIETGRNFLNNVISFFKQLPGRVASFLSSVISNLTSWASNMGKKGKEGAKNMFDAVVNGIKSLPDKILSIGSDIVHGLWNGISGAAGWLKDKIMGFGNGIINGFKKAFGINSPSKVMRDQVGKWLPPGIAEGIEKNAKVAQKAMRKLSNSLLAESGGIAVGSPISAHSAGGGIQATRGGVVQTFYQYNTSPKALSRLEIYRQTKNQLAFAKEV